MKKITKVCGIVLASLSLVSVANAAKPGAYMGAGIGYSNMENFTDATATTDGGLAGKGFAGFNFNKYFGLEAAYTQYATTTYRSNYYYGARVDYSLGALSAVVKGYLPFNNNLFNIYGLLGIAEYFAKAGNSDTNFGASAVAGFGASFDFTRHITGAVEYSRLQGHDATNNKIGVPFVNLVTFNLGYSFS